MDFFTIEIPDYLRRVVLSNKQRVKYYFFPKLPKAKKYLTSDFGYIKLGVSKRQTRIWGNLKTNEPVIKNPKVAGTPKTYLINGQDLYNQTIVTFKRNKVKDKIHEFLSSHLCKIDKLKEFPIMIYVELHDFVRDPESKLQLWDLDNRVFGWYIKSIQDVLKKLGKIPDDNILYITTIVVSFIPLLPNETKKMVIRINKEQDPRVLNHPAYNNTIAY